MAQHMHPSIEQPMFGNVRVLLRGALINFPKQLSSLTGTAHGRTICWSPTLARPTALALHRSSVPAQVGATSLPSVSETALQQLVEAEGRILRSFSAEAALDTRDAVATEEQSRALIARQEEKEVKKSTSKSRQAASKASLEGIILDDSLHSIKQQDIPRGAWTALLKLRGQGHEGFLVGGAVRDMLLGKQPKDFDILTTATPVQVKRIFGRCQIVGSRFPIALVHSEGLTLEVSSFGTKAKRDTIPVDAAALLGTPAPRNRGADRGARAAVARQGVQVTWAGARRANALSRDFTVNALMLDPFALLVYDYTGGSRDCAKRVLRAIGPPAESFQLDPARILRAIRHAARCGLAIERETAKAMEANADRLLELPQGRVRMEADALFGYGAAAASLQLLWRHRLLDVLLPQLAERFKQAKVPRNGSPASLRKEPLLSLLEELDADVNPLKPIDWTVWSAVMAAPLVDDAMSEALREGKAASRARKVEPASEEGGRKRRRRRKLSKEDGSTAEGEEEERECSRCQGAGKSAHEALRHAINNSVKELKWKGNGGESRSILPTAQWVRAAELLQAAVDRADHEQPSGYLCQRCQADSHVSKKVGANMELLLDVLDARLMKWQKQRALLTTYLQSSE